MSLSLRLPAAALAVALALPASAALAAERVREEPVSSSATLPVDLELPLRNGETLRFADLVGHRVLIVTWASW